MTRSLAAVAALACACLRAPAQRSESQPQSEARALANAERELAEALLAIERDDGEQLAKIRALEGLSALQTASAARSRLAARLHEVIEHAHGAVFDAPAGGAAMVNVPVNLKRAH